MPDSYTRSLARYGRWLQRSAGPQFKVGIGRSEGSLLWPDDAADLADAIGAHPLCANLQAPLSMQRLDSAQGSLFLRAVTLPDAAGQGILLAMASRDPAHIARLFAHRLDGIDAGFGIELARLRAPWTEPLALSQRDLEAAAEAHGTSLPACIDRLTARLGEGAVRRPAPRASHLPERAQSWGEPLVAEAPAQEGLPLHARPLKLLDRAEPIAVLYASPDGLPRRFRWRGEVHEVARAEGPERIAPEWWRERGSTRLRDYYRIEDGQGRRYWIYRAGLPGDGRGGVPDWFLQGLCG